MPIHRTLPLFLSLLFAACCSKPTAATTGTAPQDPQPMPTPYAGPKVTATLQVMESQPVQHAVAVALEAPTGGYQLVHDRTEPHGGVVRVLLTLTEPGHDEANVAMLETKHARVPLPAGKEPVEVCISTVTRGLNYIQQPPYLLAAKLAR